MFFPFSLSGLLCTIVPSGKVPNLKNVSLFIAFSNTSLIFMMISFFVDIYELYNQTDCKKVG